MKKLVFLLLLILVSIFFFSATNSSYAFIDCSSSIIYPKEVTTNNLLKYLEKKSYKDVYYFCSRDKCYNVMENLPSAVDNFVKTLNKSSPLEEQEVAFIKGYSISKIGVNNCK